MKNIMKLAVISTLMAIGIATANAQNTNIILKVTVALSGFRQVDESNAAPVKITNKDIFAALSADTNSVAFGKSAQLVLVSTEGSDALPTFQVRERGDGTNAIVTPISADIIHVESSGTEIVAKNGTTRYTILRFIYNDGAGNSFDVSGFATLRRGRISGRGIGTLNDRVISAAVTVAGTGSVDSANAVLRGTIAASGPKIAIED